MKNKRLDEIYKQIVHNLNTTPCFGIRYEKDLEVFKKFVTEEDIKKFESLFKYPNLRMLTGEIPKTLDPIEGAFKVIIDIHNAKIAVTTLLALEAIIFERDKYYAKSTMCKLCRQIRYDAFAKYEKIKSLVC